MGKKYSYSKDDRPKKKVKQRFIILAEGEREDAYFKYFERQSNDYDIDVSIVPREEGKSAPKFVDDRLAKYIQAEKWLPQYDDQLWFVFDVDRWREQVHDLVAKCEHDNVWNIAISNPCFEVWLHYHLNDKITGMTDATELKREIPNKIAGGFNVAKFIELIDTAILNSKQADTHPEQLFPGPMQTKVYKLAESLMAILKR